MRRWRWPFLNNGIIIALIKKVLADRLNKTDWIGCSLGWLGSV